MGVCPPNGGLGTRISSRTSRDSGLMVRWLWVDRVGLEGLMCGKWN